MYNIASPNKYRLKQAKLLFKPSGPLIQFRIDKKELWELPSDFLADKSPYFQKLVEEAIESPGHVVEWPDVTSETFERLAGFLLTGNNYEDALPSTIPSPSSTADHWRDFDICSRTVSRDGETSTVTEPHSSSIVEYSDDDDYSLPDTSVPFGLPCSINSYCMGVESLSNELSRSQLAGNQKRGEVEILDRLRYDAFVRFRRSFEQQSCPSGSGWTPGDHWDYDMSYHPIFISHFNLFKLADKVQMDWLSETCLYRLRRDLCTYELYDHGVSDLAHLVGEIYRGTTRGSSARDLIAEYVSCFHELLYNKEDLRQVMKNDSDIDRDVQRFIVKRLSVRDHENLGERIKTGV